MPTLTPYGTVDVLHEGRDLKVWQITKDEEQVDLELKVFRREDFLFVVLGTLKLEVGDEEVVLGAGDWYVIPRDTPFRGYRWPRNGPPCVFLAVAPADLA